MSEQIVLAAGGIIRNNSNEFLVIHRSKYDDWSFPKGKLDHGEELEECALREVHEETGFYCELRDFLGTVAYVDRKGREKKVYYWQMKILDGYFQENSEVDAIDWLHKAQALEILSYSHDRELLTQISST
ncbi:MAG: DNA mismatch repair protein MutT [Acidimicrobiaceae bacterium]|nr:DNA mismatch repair protein MutT [Acidimicrobiaceae bacterium]MEC7845010.1 NUDIX hydrolase [Actinomycetota bacterium]